MKYAVISGIVGCVFMLFSTYPQMSVDAKELVTATMFVPTKSPTPDVTLPTTFIFLPIVSK